MEITKKSRDRCPIKEDICNFEASIFSCHSNRRDIGCNVRRYLRFQSQNISRIENAISGVTKEDI